MKTIANVRRKLTMKKIVNLLLLSLMSSLLLSISHSGFAQQMLPETQLTNFRTGKTISTADLKGKVVYLDFWASWCKPCKKSFPFMNDIHNQYPKDDFVVVAINMDEFPEDAKKFLEEIPADFNIYTDASKTLATELELPGLPVAFVIDKTGEIKGRHIGFNERKKQKKIKQLEFLLGHK